MSKNKTRRGAILLVPDRPSGLGITTEKDEWWPGQREIIGQIAEAFSTKRFVLASMPTGSGKTIVATAVQKLLGLRSVVLTHTLSLQDQYKETLPAATIVTGRRNHKCSLPQPYEQEVTANLAPCAYGDDCEYIRADGCSYYRMLFEAAGNDQTILNYAYATRILQQPSLRKIERPVGDTYGGTTTKNPFWRDLLICDEGDLAEPAVVDAARIIIHKSSWDKVGIDLPKEQEEVAAW